MPELNLQIVEESKATMKAKFSTMVQYFMEDAVIYMNEIKAGLVEKDAKKIKSPAHTIKSSSKLFGADRISESAMQIEQLAADIIEGRETDIGKIAPLFEFLQKAYNDAEPELKALIG